MTLGDPVAQAEFPVFVAAQNFHEGAEGPELPDRTAVRRAVDGVAGYLDRRMTRDGGWAVAHPYWPGQIRQDPQAIAVLTQGYLKRAQSSHGGPNEARARRGLEWLVKHQRADGSFGLPWAFGPHQGHFGEPAHYGGGPATHAAGDPLAVVTIAAASALLEGFKVYGNSRYLASSVRAMHYLLRGANGFQWLDAQHTRGSIPYCNLRSGPPADRPEGARARRRTPRGARHPGRGLQHRRRRRCRSSRRCTSRPATSGSSPMATRLRTTSPRQVRGRRLDPVLVVRDARPGPADTPTLSFTGLLEYGEMRGRKDWVAQAGRGFSWMANHARGGLVPTEGYASVYGLNLSAGYRDVRQQGDPTGNGRTVRSAVGRRPGTTP